jgi:integration host factor subunit alpha
MALTKDKLAARLQTQIGMTKPESRQIMERLFAIMKSTLGDGEDLLISGFGTFLVKQKNPRRGRNPQTKEALMLKARKVLVFKTSRVLREKINWP